MNKLAIVNGAPASEMLAPFKDPEYDIWVLGNRIANYDLDDVDRIFEIHDDLSEHGDIEEYCKKLLDTQIPLTVGEDFPLDSEYVERFDYLDDKKFFGSTYLTSSTVYMLSEAARRGYNHIELYGVNMHMDELEYFYQRPCLEMWIGFLRGQGRTVLIHESSPVGRSDYIEGKGSGGKPEFLQGLKPFTMKEFMGMAGEHQKKIDELNAQIQQIKDQRNLHDGAKQIYDRLSKVARAVEQGQPVKSLAEDVIVK